jgi:hypothetical protein
LPVYIRSPEDDPNAVSVLTTGDYASLNPPLDLELEPHYQLPKQPSYQQMLEDTSYERTPGNSRNIPLPEEPDERPPYAYESTPPEQHYHDAHLALESIHSNDPDLSPSEASTFMSGDFPMLRPPHSPSSSSSQEEYPSVQNFFNGYEAPSEQPASTSNAGIRSWANDDTLPYDTPQHVDWDHAGPSNVNRRPTNDLRAIRNFVPEPDYDDFDDEGEEEDPRQFFELWSLSNIAAELQNKVPRGTHVKGSIPYPRAFTGKDIVVR